MSAIARRLADLPDHAQADGTGGGAGELWYVLDGAGQVSLGAGPWLPVGADHGIWVPPGCRYQILADAGGLRLDMVTLPAAGTSQPGDAGPALTPLRDCAVEMTGDRQFQVLFGPGQGCPVATQFVGEIPPGRAPEHRHPYDEVVLVLAGSGIAHVAGTDVAIAAGSTVHLPPGVPHCLENKGDVTLRVLGVFHPADSPAAKLDALHIRHT